MTEAKSRKHKAFYMKKKSEGKCTDCGRKLTKYDRQLSCNECALRRRMSLFETRLRRVEVLFDKFLKIIEEEDVKNNNEQTLFKPKDLNSLNNLK